MPSPTHVPNYLESVQSQLPALQLLTELGWEYLPPAQVDELRGKRRGQVILEPILANFLRETGRFEFKGREHAFTESAIQEAIRELKDTRATAAMHQNAEMYELLCLGKSLKQTVEGDSKSFQLQFIDWKHPERNRLHCTAEMRIERVGERKVERPDIILFVNGLPMVIIECKRSTYVENKKDPMDLAVEQLTRYQRKDHIPQLFLFSQLLLALGRDQAEYGTTGTPRKFFSVWREDGVDPEVKNLISRVLAHDHPMLGAPFENVADEFLILHEGGREVTTQDRALYSLCQPARLLELVFQNIVYDNGRKKIARYQQFFTIQDILRRVLQIGAGGSREGGVVWHTQGSGKSLTMVMLAKALVLSPKTLTPKVILVTDRVDLDDQIYGTFRACGHEPVQAKSGKKLAELLRSDRTTVITTTIHKFEAASKNPQTGGEHRETFVLIDEGHRSNYSESHARMRLALKGACFIAFTGTPLARNAKKNTFRQFGPMFDPAYTIARAVEDRAVLPLIYEARHVPQEVDQKSIDNWFEKITANLSDEQRADLKRKFSTDRELNKAEQKVRMIAHDIGAHFSVSFQGTGLKGQLVAPDKATALLYKECFDEWGTVKTEVLISAPDIEEGEDKKGANRERVRKFWATMIDRYGTEKKYNTQVINAFKHGEEPEIIIVVDKLLTGFDAPCNTVLYLARKLKDHTLLQAIARVNRLHEGKSHGFIMDYSGVIEELDEAIDFYSQLADFDDDDLANTVSLIEEEIAALPQAHSALWDLFPGLLGSTDHEAFLIRLREDDKRSTYYDRYSRFARHLSTALSSTTFLEETTQEQIDRYKRDLIFFQNLRANASMRFQERIDYSEYEPRIKKLLDTHVSAPEIITLSEPIDLFDPLQRAQVIEDEGKSPEARADMIASATQRVIEVEMDKDPAFYTRFSKMLSDVIEALHAQRITALEALDKLKDIATKVATRTGDDVPAAIAGKDHERRFFGTIREVLKKNIEDENVFVTLALEIRQRIQPHKIRDWRNNEDALNRMRGEIDDLLFDLAAEKNLSIPIEIQDTLLDRCIELAIANED